MFTVDPKQSPTKSVASSKKDASNVSRMRLRFNELVDDAFSLFGSPGSSPKSGVTYTVPDERKQAEKKPGYCLILSEYFLKMCICF